MGRKSLIVKRRIKDSIRKMSAKEFAACFPWYFLADPSIEVFRRSDKTALFVQMMCEAVPVQPEKASLAERRLTDEEAEALLLKLWNADYRYIGYDGAGRQSLHDLFLKTVQGIDRPFERNAFRRAVAAAYANVAIRPSAN